MEGKANGKFGRNEREKGSISCGGTINRHKGRV